MLVSTNENLKLLTNLALSMDSVKKINDDSTIFRD